MNIKMENIIENNKLIAEFMGKEKCKRCEIDCGGYYFGALIFTPLEMKYNNSWDWLMPVVEKINQDYVGFRIKFGNVNCLVDVFDNLKNPPVKKIINPDAKTAIYTAVVEFIKWYNLTK